MKELTGHTSPETAYLVPDYPYGFRLRTEIRYWIETKAGHGQRVMSQTRNPKRAGQPWNKPNASTYNALKVLYLNEENGHVESTGLSDYANEAEIQACQALYPETCADARNRDAIDVLTARQRAYARVTWTVGAPTDGRPRQTAEEQNAIMRKLTIIELHNLRNESGDK